LYAGSFLFSTTGFFAQWSFSIWQSAPAINIAQFNGTATQDFEKLLWKIQTGYLV
jgi:hypothetical protein